MEKQTANKKLQEWKINNNISLNEMVKLMNCKITVLYDILYSDKLITIHMAKKIAKLTDTRAIEWYDPDKQDNPKKKTIERYCLRCNRRFLTDSKFIRLCYRCKNNKEAKAWVDLLDRGRA